MMIIDFDYCFFDCEVVYSVVFDLLIELIDLSNWNFYIMEVYGLFYKCLCEECFVYFIEDSCYGVFWLIIWYDYIKEIDKDYKCFLLELMIMIDDFIVVFDVFLFIVMDLFEYDVQCKLVFLVVVLCNLVEFESMICECVVGIFDLLLFDEEFNWVDKVLIEFIM